MFKYLIMNSLAIIIGLITLCFIWWNLWISIKIIQFLKSKGEEVSLFNNGFFIRGKIFKYLPLYRKLTIENQGQTGNLYILFYTSFFLFLIFLIFGIIVVAWCNMPNFLSFFIDVILVQLTFQYFLSNLVD